MRLAARISPSEAEASTVQDQQRFVGQGGAVLLMLSLLSGFFVAGGMTGAFPVDGKMALGAHVSGLLGALFLFAYAWSLPLLRLGAAGRMRIAYALMVGNFGNLLIGSAKAIPAARGITLTEDLANNAVFGLLNVFVVLPLLAAAGGWIYGLRK